MFLFLFISEDFLQDQNLNLLHVYGQHAKIKVNLRLTENEKKSIINFNMCR